MASKRGLFSHLSIGVKSYTTSKKFYTELLTPLGVTLLRDDPARKTLMYGIGTEFAFIIFERGEDAQSPGAGTHLAFNAPSRKAVKEFWDAGISNGGRDEGEPGLRKDYSKDYYAAFLFDPDGFKLEAVCLEAEGGE